MSFSATAQSTPVKNDTASVQIVEASCGQCNFGLTDQEGCDLAVKINGKAYWVTGTDIDKHGDSHSAGGFCLAVRKAEVIGEIVDGKFNVSYFKLLPLKSDKKGHEGHNHN
ncbi:MAG: hypothetical protein JKX68_04745 [Flavobacteriales bacterium]|nr:hypothetical protein [Flavobacteriales bacterium]